MRISKVEIKNYRSIKGLTINLHDMTALVGPNNAGKSNILTALDLFFKVSIKGISEEDFFLKNTSKSNSIEIIVTFIDLDDDEKQSLKEYIIKDKVVVKKIIFYNDDDATFHQKLQGLSVWPSDPVLKKEDLDANKTKIKDLVEAGTLPTAFLGASGRVSKESFENGIKELRVKSDGSQKWVESWSESFFGWKSVAEGHLMDFLYLPAVKDASDETKHTTTSFFGKIIDEIAQTVEPSDKMNEIINHFESMKKILTSTATTDERLPELFKLEKQITDTLCECMPGIKVNLTVGLPDFKDILCNSELSVDDGISTSVSLKGHGLQRIFIFTLFRLYSSLLKTRKEKESKHSKVLFFAIEEPEIYLHPQLQRHFKEILRTVSQQDQLLFCSHSAYFIDLLQYNEVIIINKKSIEEGSIAIQVERALFDNEDKKKFKLLTEFDPNVTEFFFANYVILVEGDTEEILIKILSKKFDKNLNAIGATIINGHSKENLPFFEDILNNFKKSFSVVHDTDIKQGLSDDAILHNRELNASIFEKASAHRIVTFEPDIEGECGFIKLSSYLLWEKWYDKPLADFPEKLISKIKLIFEDMITT